MIGTDEPYWINQNIYNRFYGSLEPLRDMSKLQDLCIDSTDIDSGLEYLSDSLRTFWTDPHNRQNAKVAKIREQLKPYNYNFKSWRIINKSYPNLLIKKTELETQIQKVEKELEQTKQNESERVGKITRLESELKLLKETHSKLKTELDREKQEKQNWLLELTTIIFPSSSVTNNLGFADLREQIKKIIQSKNETEANLKIAIDTLNANNEEFQKKNNQIRKLKTRSLSGMGITGKILYENTPFASEKKQNQFLTETIQQLQQELAAEQEKTKTLTAELEAQLELTTAKQLVPTETGWKKN